MKPIKKLLNDIRIDLTSSLFHVQETIPSVTTELQTLFAKDTSLENQLEAIKDLAEYKTKFKHNSDNMSKLIDSLQELAPRLAEIQNTGNESNQA